MFLNFFSTSPRKSSIDSASFAAASDDGAAVGDADIVVDVVRDSCMDIPDFK